MEEIFDFQFRRRSILIEYFCTTLYRGWHVLFKATYVKKEAHRGFVYYVALRYSHYTWKSFT